MSPFDSSPEGTAGEPLREPIESYIAIVNDLVTTELETTLPEAWLVPDNLHKAMQYSLMAGGKRLRPLLVVAACEALGGSRAAALPVAAAIEMVHTYSLVHDDLPAMDNDDYRRGKLTNHKVFGEATAILAGDALLTHAFYSIVQATRRHGIPAESSLAIVEELAEMAGPRGMVGGQVADMEGEQGLTSLEQLRYIHEHKTGDLFIFSLLAGGRIAGANEQQLAALREFGTNIGLAFQVQDDILDLIGDEGKLGKKTGSDIEQQKVTYPFFIGIEASKSEVERLTLAARKAVLDGGFTDVSRLLEIADYLMKRDH
ncbi:polyprenyl synthetase [Bacillus sp. FJAT-27264]|uniref:polyprenyl synthetase family protein n=1 Tax=Paenibacillus sp. (strain DSM 101736 / FJAT-27264) TaxID=1850362 RepID=UPI000807C7F8|nr:farnesyl diphosphate synthase [Bacillus sp. FJAT-27264]OBZ18934.1 polyprenyl synthetase [Bacillus sp. FJAT-27264]